MPPIRLYDFQMRLVDESDAEFIIALRMDPILSKHLSKTPNEISAQREWIKRYKIREAEKKEFYFVSESYSGEKYGLTRIYNFKFDRFELGSWIFKKNIDEMISIRADIATRDFAFFHLGFEKCLFAVAKDNKSVLKYHEMFGPVIEKQDRNEIKFRLDKSTYLNGRQKLIKIFSNGY